MYQESCNIGIFYKLCRVGGLLNGLVTGIVNTMNFYPDRRLYAERKQGNAAIVACF
jgi:hypothetical protein